VYVSLVYFIVEHILSLNKLTSKNHWPWLLTVDFRAALTSEAPRVGASSRLSDLLQPGCLPHSDDWLYGDFLDESNWFYKMVFMGPPLWREPTGFQWTTPFENMRLSKYQYPSYPRQWAQTPSTRRGWGLTFRMFLDAKYQNFSDAEIHITYS